MRFWRHGEVTGNLGTGGFLRGSGGASGRAAKAMRCSGSAARHGVKRGLGLSRRIELAQPQRPGLATRAALGVTGRPSPGRSPPADPGVGRRRPGGALRRGVLRGQGRCHLLILGHANDSVEPAVPSARRPGTLSMPPQHAMMARHRDGLARRRRRPRQKTCRKARSPGARAAGLESAPVDGIARGEGSIIRRRGGGAAALMRQATRPPTTEPRKAQRRLARRMQARRRGDRWQGGRRGWRLGLPSIVRAVGADAARPCLIHSTCRRHGRSCRRLSSRLLTSPSAGINLCEASLGGTARCSAAGTLGFRDGLTVATFESRLLRIKRESHARRGARRQGDLGRDRRRGELKVAISGASARALGGWRQRVAAFQR